MDNSSFDRRYISKYVRGRTVLVIVVVFFTALSAFFAVSNVRTLAADAAATYTSTTGEVVSEGTQRVIEGSRRNRHWVEYRAVTIEHTVPGTSGSDEVRSDTIQVGDTLDIWVRDQTGDVQLEAPTPPDFWQWFWAVTMSVITALFVWGLIVTLRNTVRLMAFRPDGRTPDFTFALQNIAVVNGGRKGKTRTLQLTGAMLQSTTATRVGARAELSSSAKAMPEAPTYPPQLLGYSLKPGAESDIVVIHAPELSAWWIAHLRYPGDLTTSPAQDAKPAASA